MFVGHYTEVPEKDTGFEGVTIRWLVSPKLGAKNYAMRYFVLKKGAEIPLHDHDWEHEIFIVKGEGIITNGKEEFHVREGDFLYVPPNESHGYKATGETLEFLCIIPAKREAIPEDEWA
ncbi:cupin domain-containing protein [Thermococcus sp. 18S1]|uniref:cupin domain-containing protein n=1 Tax=Thermococcus sp. 18S1 TaxID=1638210 RepID=UPI00143C8D41|nr:cupin domain-containing protein [Thermococcus sp. 18S1]NJE30014.1 cupin domain-containing protein [Thermococcus sp. 18S1]